MAHTRRLVLIGPLVVVLTMAFFTARPSPAGAGSASGPLTVSGVASAEQDIASDGTNFLVVWTQYTGTSSGVREVYGALITDGGTQVHGLGAISSGADGRSDETPAVAWNGSHYLVVWQQTFASGDLDVLGRRVDATGTLVGNIFNVATPSGNQRAATVAASGSTFLAAWVDERSGAGDIRGGRITDAGALLDTDGGIVMASDGRNEDNPAVAGSTSGFFLAYQLQFSSSDVDVYGKAVTASLGLGSALPLATGSDIERLPAVASDGTQFLAVWGDQQETVGGVDIQGVRIQSGAATGGLITISNATGGQTLPDVAFNGTFLAVWRDTRGGHGSIYGTRITTAGAVQEGDGFVIWDNQGTGGVTGPTAAKANGGQKWGVVYDNALAEGVLFRTASSK